MLSIERRALFLVDFKKNKNLSNLFSVNFTGHIF
jgi:hypothetical protein